MNHYTTGTLVQLNLSVTTATGAFINPTTLTFRIQTPDSVITDYSTSVTNSSVGVYYATFTPSQVGLHQYEWIGTGAAQVATLGQFLVTQGTF